MSKLCVALAVLSMAATTASAATVDVDNLLEGSWAGSVSGFSARSAEIVPGSRITDYAFQTWTVGQTGKLAQVDLVGSVGSAYSTDGVSYQAGEPLSFDVTLTILGGGTTFTPGDQVLGSVTKSAADVVNYGVTSFDLSALDIYAAAGTMLTWRMSVDECPMLYCVQGWFNANDFTASGGGTTNGYAGGGAFLEGNGVLYNFGQFDLNFRTLMAVPEPATWALMILGLIGVGGALRRQRPRMA